MNVPSLARVAVIAVIVSSVVSVSAWGRGKPPPTPPPNPDVVYMSASSSAPSKPEIRGVTVAVTDGNVNGTDSKLLRAVAGRQFGSIAWSPDGAVYAWVEGQDQATAKIMWARPGQEPAVLYQPASASDPYIWSGVDMLAWGAACSGSGSVLAFASAAKANTELQQYTENPAIWVLDIDPIPSGSGAPSVHGLRKIHEQQVYWNDLVASDGALAFSPTGSHLAFRSGLGKQATISSISMCAPSFPTTMLLTFDDVLAATYPNACDNAPGSPCPCDGNPQKVCYSYPGTAIHSMDWSGDGRRLALSVTVGPDPDYDWRDLRIAYLDWNPATQTFTKNRVEVVDFDGVFGAASSEHSPQWGSGPSNSDCERLAFSQSAGAVDGSTMNGRRLFLYDLVTSNTACLSAPREISARYPRAIDWK